MTYNATDRDEEEEERRYDPLQDMQDFLNDGMRAPDKNADEREGDDDEQPWD